MALTQIGSVETVNPQGGQQRTYTRDALERTTQVSTADGKNFTYEYYGDGAIKAVIYPGGSIRTDYTYDNANRVKTIVTKKGSSVLYQASYTYDNNGNILTVTGTDPVTYTYDSMNRLASETRNGATTTYVYDSRGNLVKETKGTEVTNYTYAGDNRLTQVEKNGTITTYEYDLNGNRIADSSGSQYGYDEENLLAYAGKGDTVSTYGIGTDGLRNAKTVSETTTGYTTDQDGNVIREGTDDIIRGHQVLAKRTADGSYYYYIYNAHGDVVMMLDESGNVKNTYKYDAWGKITSETETVPNSIKYAGEYYDTETGFIYLRNRMYDPATRRFTSEDPARDQLNWYAYCGNNPVMRVDSTGLEWNWIRALVDEVGGTLEYDSSSKTTTVNVNGNIQRYTTINGQVFLGIWKVGYIDNDVMMIDDIDFYLTFFGGNSDLINYSKTQHSQSDSGLRHLSDDEIKRGVKTLKGEEKRRYQREQKYRGLRNKQKRKNTQYITVSRGDVIAASGVAVGAYVIYQGVKWIVAAVLSGPSAGGSLALSAILP